MSKKAFKKQTTLNRVTALPSRIIKNAKGEVTKVLYNLFLNR